MATYERRPLTTDGQFNATSKALLVDTGGGFAPASPGSFEGGTKTVTLAATPETLVASPTPCRGVWIGAPEDADGVAENTKPAFIGDTTTQNIPLNIANFEGYVIYIDDAVKIKIKVGVNGEKVVYRIIANE